MKENQGSDENLDRDVGQIIMVYFVSAFLACSFGGYIIDKFKRFKLTACCWYLAAVCGFATFCYIVKFGNKSLFLFISSLFGLCQMGLIPVTFSFGGELVYPEPESTSTALLSVMPDLWGIFAIEIVKHFLNFEDPEKGRIVASIFTLGCGSVGVMAMFFVKEKTTLLEISLTFCGFISLTIRCYEV